MESNVALDFLKEHCYLDSEFNVRLKKKFKYCKYNIGDVLNYYIHDSSKYKKSLKKKPNKYYVTSIGRKFQFRLHRIIFFLHYGYMPKIIDHIDRNKLNNHPNNLRESTKQINSFNTDVLASNSSGIKNVSWSDRNKRWIGKAKLLNGRFKQVSSTDKFMCARKLHKLIIDFKLEHYYNDIEQLVYIYSAVNQT